MCADPVIQFCVVRIAPQAVAERVRELESERIELGARARQGASPVEIRILGIRAEQLVVCDGLPAERAVRIGDDAVERIRDDIVQLTAESKMLSRKLVRIDIRIPIHQSAPTHACVSCFQHRVIA